jgi:hypothetical protein
MSNGETWYGIPLHAPPGSSLPSNVIFVPENAPHYYDENGDLQVVSISPGTDGNLPPLPPTQNQIPGMAITKPINTTEPQAVFNSDGICTTAGWTPGGIYYCVGDPNMRPCSTGGPLNKAKKDALYLVLVWALAYKALVDMTKDPNPE